MAQVLKLGKRGGRGSNFSLSSYAGLGGGSMHIRARGDHRTWSPNTYSPPRFLWTVTSIDRWHVMYNQPSEFDYLAHTCASLQVVAMQLASANWLTSTTFRDRWVRFMSCWRCDHDAWIGLDVNDAVGSIGSNIDRRKPPPLSDDGNICSFWMTERRANLTNITSCVEIRNLWSLFWIRV